MGRFETSREEVSWRSDIISVIIVIKIYVITSSSPAIDKELLTTNNITYLILLLSINVVP